MICVYMCIYIHMCIYIYLYTSIYIYINMSLCVYANRISNWHVRFLMSSKGSSPLRRDAGRAAVPWMYRGSHCRR